MGELRHCELGFPERPAGLLTAAEGRVLAEMEAPEAVAGAIDERVAAGFPGAHPLRPRDVGTARAVIGP